MIVPELPADIRELKARVGRFVEEEVYPLEQRIVERDAIDAAEVDALRRKARDGRLLDAQHAAGLGRPRPLDARPGRARGGVGQGDERARLRRRRPRPARAARDRDPDAGGAVRRCRSCAASTARRGRSPSPAPARTSAALAATATRDGDDWVLNGEKWFVTSEGDPGFYIVAAVARGRADAVPRRAGHARARDRADAAASCTTRTSTTIRRSSSATAVCPTRTGSRRAAARARRSGSSSSASSSPPAAAARRERLLDLATTWAQEREAFGAPIAEYQGVSFPLADSLTELLAARLLTYHAAHAFDTLANRKIVHGKVAMAKLYASEMAGRVADRALQILGGRGYMHREPGRALLPRAPRRPDLGGNERDPAADHRATGSSSEAPRPTSAGSGRRVRPGRSRPSS